MKVAKFKLAFVVLLIATIVWGIAFYYTHQEYRKWYDEQQWDEWSLRTPYWAWNGGLYVIVAGEFLLVGWLIFIWKLVSEKVYPYLKSWRRK